MSSKESKKSFVKLSKKLSYLLRHGALEHGLELRPDGYAEVKKVLALPLFNNRLSLSTLRRLVNNNEKQRFKLMDENGILFVRANQGHSQKVSSRLNSALLMKPIESADEIEVPLVHGTYRKAVPLIIQSGGLKRMQREHVHFAVGLPEDQQVISGMRTNCQVVVYVNLAKALDMGLKFFVSSNKVVLTPGVGDEGLVPLDCIDQIVDRSSGEEYFSSSSS